MLKPSLKEHPDYGKTTGTKTLFNDTKHIKEAHYEKAATCKRKYSFDFNNDFISCIDCFGSTLILAVMNFFKKKETEPGKAIVYFKKALVSLVMTGLLITPFAGSFAVIFTGVGSMPAAGLELLAGNRAQGQMNRAPGGNNNSAMVDFLLANKTSSQKYLLVVSSSNEAAEIIINTGEPVMAIGGFLGSDKSITLDQFIDLVKKGEVRYVMAGGNRGGGNGGGNGGGSYSSVIMNWVTQNGTAVSTTGEGNFGQLYDLKPYADKLQ